MRKMWSEDVDIANKIARRIEEWIKKSLPDQSLIIASRQYIGQVTIYNRLNVDITIMVIGHVGRGRLECLTNSSWDSVGRGIVTPNNTKTFDLIDPESLPGIQATIKNALAGYLEFLRGAMSRDKEKSVQTMYELGRLLEEIDKGEIW